MRTRSAVNALFLFSILFPGCSKSGDHKPSARYGEVEIVISDIPFRSEQNLRIPYTLKMWEFMKDGLTMQQIIILDDDSKSVLLTLNKADLPFLYKAPLPVNPYIQFDNIDSYYLSVQLPVPLVQSPPLKISHRFLFNDTIQNKEVTIEGGVFTPRINEFPIAISSPVKGSHLLFYNQSTDGYHFHRLFFINGELKTAERFAFDNSEVNKKMDNFYEGDPAVNTSYFSYRDTLYAVSDGIVVAIQDTLPENNGNTHNLTFSTLIELCGNFIILDIGGGRYASYAHCVPHSCFVQAGDTVKEGDPVALLGNSGNSDAPHLHFQIGDSPDFFFCNGIPFVLKKFTKIGELQNPGGITPTEYTNSMMNWYTVFWVD